MSRCSYYKLYVISESINCYFSAYAKYIIYNQSRRIYEIHRLIPTTRKQVWLNNAFVRSIAVSTLTDLPQTEFLYLTPEVVQPSLYVVHIPPISKRIHISKCSRQCSCDRQRFPSRVVSVFYHPRSGVVKQRCGVDPHRGDIRVG